jgi:glycosyltransferase involved in cell wall biosynthesis
MKRKIRILHVISDTNFGGAGRLIVNLSKSIDRQRFEFVFAIPDGSRLENILRQEGRVVCFKGEGDASFSFSNIPSLCRIIKGVKPDIVHTHSSLSGRIAAAVCGVNKAGRVYTKHCVFDCSNAKKSNLRRKIYNIFDDLLSGGVVAVADSAKQELVCEGVSQAKISVIINGSLPLERYCENQKNNPNETKRCYLHSAGSSVSSICQDWVCA